MGLFAKLFGSRSQREVKSLNPIVNRIEALEEEYKQLTDQQLRDKTDEFRARLAQGETLDDLLPEAFATCWVCAPIGCSSSAASSSIRGALPRCAPARVRRWWPPCRPTSTD